MTLAAAGWLLARLHCHAVGRKRDASAANAQRSTGIGVLAIFHAKIGDVAWTRRPGDRADDVRKAASIGVSCQQE